MPFGLVEYVAVLGEYMKDKVVRPELEGQKINPDWSTVMSQTQIRFYYSHQYSFPFSTSLSWIRVLVSMALHKQSLETDEKV